MAKIRFKHKITGEIVVLDTKKHRDAALITVYQGLSSMYSVVNR